jgi:hypothetical protein
MLFTGSHNIDKYVLPLLLDFKTVVILLNSSRYFKNIIHNCKKISKLNIFPDIHVLFSNDNHKCLKLFIKTMDVNRLDKYGYSFLHYVCAYGYIKCINLLLQHGADVNIRDGYGGSAFFFAAYSRFKNNSAECIDLLNKYKNIENIENVMYK